MASHVRSRRVYSISFDASKTPVVRDRSLVTSLRRARAFRAVLPVGSGLTALDVVSVLHDSIPTTRLTLVSHHGLLARTHRTNPGA